MLKYCVDFDDLYDGIASRSMELLQAVKDKYPQFKVTLFTIPNRTSDLTIKRFKEHDKWIALAPHGWHHTRGECLTWPLHVATAKIQQAADRGIDAPVFRAPAWIINRATYEACRDLEITVADHRDNYLGVLGCRRYCYNDPAWRAPKLRPTHGHLTNCAVDNFISDMASDGRLTFATKSEFAWPWDVDKLVTEQDLLPQEITV